MNHFEVKKKTKAVVVRQTSRSISSHTVQQLLNLFSWASGTLCFSWASGTLCFTYKQRCVLVGHLHRIDGKSHHSTAMQRSANFSKSNLQCGVNRGIKVIYCGFAVSPCNSNGRLRSDSSVSDGMKKVLIMYSIFLGFTHGIGNNGLALHCFCHECSIN